MKKRLLSILLALCMVLALLPGTVFALNADEDDHTPPVVTGVYMNSPGGTVTVGDTLYFSVSAEDESGIDLDLTSLSFRFLCEQGDWHYHTAYARAKSYEEETGLLKFELTISNSILDGTYTLSSVRIYDTYGNEAYYSQGFPGDIDFAAASFTVTGSPATEPEEVETEKDPPVVTSITMEDPGKDVSVGDILYFTVAVEDESGIDMDATFVSSWLYFTNVCGKEYRHTESARPWAYDRENGLATFALTVTDRTLNGSYTLSSVELRDTCGNYAYYSTNDPGDIEFDAVYFEITGSPAVDDHDPPVALAVSMEEPGKAVAAGDTLNFTVAVEEESGINMWSSYLYFTFICEQGHEHTVSARGYEYYGGFYDEETKQATFVLTITEDMLNGTYKLSSVSCRDNSVNSNSAYYYPERPGNIDFDAVWFVIATPDILPEEVSIPETLSLPVRSTRTISPTVLPEGAVVEWTWTSADTGIAEVFKVENGTAAMITGVAPGTTTITGTTQNGITATCVVTVTEAPLPESGTIDETYQVDVGGFVDIEPVLTPEGATTLYEVSSDNPHVAGIALTNGGTAIRIQGINPGTATITIRGANNLVMTTTVRVGKETDIQHEKKTIEGYPATCGWPGWTDGLRCSACWYIFTEPQEIPATGEHTWGAWRVVQAATSTTAGSRERYCETCGERETQAIPATGSTSGGGWSGSYGGGSGGGSGSSSGSNNSGSVTSDGQSVQATVTGGTAEITHSDKNISNIIDGAENGAVHIDASANKNVTEVSIPKGVVDAITENGMVSAVSVTTNAGTVELHEEALNTISNAMTGSNDTVSLEVKTIDVNTIPSTQKYPIADVLNSAVFINLSASIQHKDANGRTTSTEAIHEFGGSVTVSVPFELPANMEGRQIIACHIADDGAITYFPVTYENGVATFTTTHFSTFAVVESRAAALKDIDISAWYMLSVEYVLNSGLMQGVGDSKFDPSGTTTRGMIMTILARIDGIDTSASSPWYQTGMEWAMREGVSDGTSPGTDITREQLATMLWRFADKPASATGLSAFPDVDQTSDWAGTAMAWAVEKGIIIGTDGKLNPQGNATRAQAATMLMRFCESIAK